MRNVFDRNKDKDPNEGRELTQEEAEKLAGKAEATLAKLPEGYHYELAKDANGNDTVVIKKDRDGKTFAGPIAEFHVDDRERHPIFRPDAGTMPSDRHRIQ